MARRPPAAASFAEPADHPEPRARWLYAFLAAAVLSIYLPSLGNGFVDWDDQAYVVQNPHVDGISGANLAWAFTTFHQANWHPLTWISHALDRQLYGLDPFGHHLTSVLLHALNAVLLLIALRRLTGRLWPSAAVAALFALHPLRVENVAWVAERKDLLCSCFFLLTLIAYERYVRAPSRKGYLAVVFALALALLSKPMAVTLPFVLLLLDVWPLRRLRWPPDLRVALLEKAPLLALAAASSVVTYLAQDAGRAVRSLETIGLGERLANVPVTLVAYLYKMLWPAPGTLLPFYTHPHHLAGGHLGPGEVALATFAVAALTGLAFWQWRQRPYLLIGWLWYVGMLVPVLGLVQVGSQQYADRYTYLPLIGPLFAVVWLFGGYCAGEFDRLRGALALVLLALTMEAALTALQQKVWRSAESLWRYNVAGDPQSPIARLNLANTLHAAGRGPEALGHYRQAVALNERYAPAHAALAVRLGEKGDFDAALEHFQKALALDPTDVHARASLGNTLLQAGRQEEGVAELRAAFERAPKEIAIGASLAKALTAAGRSEEALAVYENARSENPASPAAHNNLAIAYLRAGRREEGIAALREAVRLDPKYRSGHQNLALALKQAGDEAGAEKHLAIARELE